MTDSFVTKIDNYIKENQMLKQNDTVVLGVSGGADSVALLQVLYLIKDDYKLKLKVVHINHGLRTEAISEAEYVKKLCEERNIPFVLQEHKIDELAKKNGLGTEEMGRIIRYQAFNDTLGNNNGVIAVAHNMNDRAETMLFHLFRGTGIKGLASILPVRDKIIRPLLCTTREEIEAFLGRQNITFCTDQSNFSDEYTRNRIRQTLIPQIKELVSKAAVEHMNETAGQLWEINLLAENLTDEAASKGMISSERDKLIFDRGRFLKEHSFIQKALVKRFIDLLVPKNKDITHVHLESAVDIVKKEGNHSINLPYRIKLSTVYNQIEVCITSEINEKEPTTNVDLNIPGLTVAGKLGRFECFVSERDENTIISTEKYTKSFDYDKVNKAVQVRTRMTGDYVVVNSEGGTKKLKDYLIDEKVPSDKRDSIPVLAVGQKVLWVIGFRISEDIKITESTKKVLTIKYVLEEE